jgi:hypothetical protein
MSARNGKKKKKTVKIKIKKLGHSPFLISLYSTRGQNDVNTQNFEFKSDFDLFFSFAF